MSTQIKRIAISTGGGDAPGLNAVIHAAVHAATALGWEVFGIRDGFEGLLAGDPTTGLMPLNRDAVRNIAHLGGTILGTTNRGNPLKQAGAKGEVDRTDELISRFKDARLDALIAIGGDGTLSIANQLSKRGLPIVGVPKTI